jgi:hypothetical protein
MMEITQDIGRLRERIGEERARSIARLKERIAEAERDLARMAKFKKGTYFETSRVENLEGMRRSLARLERTRA